MKSGIFEIVKGGVQTPWTPPGYATAFHTVVLERKMSYLKNHKFYRKHLFTFTHLGRFPQLDHLYLPSPLRLVFNFATISKLDLKLLFSFVFKVALYIAKTFHHFSNPRWRKITPRPPPPPLTKIMNNDFSLMYVYGCRKENILRNRWEVLEVIPSDLDETFVSEKGIVSENHHVQIFSCSGWCFDFLI